MQQTSSEAMDFRDYLRPLRARWWLIAIIAIVAAVGTYRYYSGKSVFYSASTSLYMTPNTGSLPGQTAPAYDPTFIPNQAILLRTESVAVIAAKYLHYRGNPAFLLGSVSAVPQGNTDFMTVSAVASNPVDAGRIANAFAQAYIASQETNSAQLIAQELKTQQQNLATIPQDAAHQTERDQVSSEIAQLQLAQAAPTAPAKQVQPAGLGVSSASDPKSHAIYGLILGLVIGIAIAYALDALDRRIRRVPEIEAAYEAPVLVKVPWTPPRILTADPRRGLPQPLAEAFRTLRTNLQLHPSVGSNGNGNGAGHPLKTIMVASALPGEGKSTVARNLALAYLESGHRVVLVDCDLRHPKLSATSGIDAVPGLPEVLTGVASLSEALRTIDVANDDLPLIVSSRDTAEDEGVLMLAQGGQRDRFWASRRTIAEPALSTPELAILPSRTPPWNPAAIFGGERFKDVLQTLRAEFDVVILDSSPLNAVSDASPVLALVDGIVFVSRLKRTTIPAVKELKTLLARLPHANILGVVANDVRERNATYVYSRAYEMSS